MPIFPDTYDPREWAKSFCEDHPGVDLSVAEDWFTSAVRHGDDVRRSREGFILADLENLAVFVANHIQDNDALPIDETTLTEREKLILSALVKDRGLLVFIETYLRDRRMIGNIPQDGP